tara:strand:+ start:392 stop:1204 length:813 start_codon:yes stop_codon:yes gene_type:complete
MFINKIKYFLKTVLTKVGLKPLIVSFLNSNVWKKYLFPLFFFIWKLPLRLKYYKIFKFYSLVPTEHLVALDILKKISSIYEIHGIKFFLTGGQLLGAIRQESMAGRPSDIDLGLIDTHFVKFYQNIDLIKKNFSTNEISHSTNKKELNISDPDFAIVDEQVKLWIKSKERTFYRFNEDRIQFRLNGMLVDIAFFSLKTINGINYWAGEKLKTKNKEYVYFLENDLLDLDIVNLYNYKFYSPKNAQKYLDRVYGENWRLPEKKQFIWKKNF